MKKQSILSTHTFKDYMSFLKDALSSLEEYRFKTGKYPNKIRDIRKGLQHSDPFIAYKATIAATLLLADNSIYH